MDNLVDNAISYTPSQGHITVSLTSSGGMATIEIEDDGIGIKPEEQGRIFERFYRVDKAHSREVSGTGLGLAIVKHIAINHHGHVAVESTLGEGSVFRISLPLTV